MENMKELCLNNIVDTYKSRYAGSKDEHGILLKSVEGDTKMNGVSLFKYNLFLMNKGDNIGLLEVIEEKVGPIAYKVKEETFVKSSEFEKKINFYGLSLQHLENTYKRI